MYTPTNEDYRIIEVDTSNRCQLKCPDCNRQDPDFKNLLANQKQLGPDDFKLMLEKFPNVSRFFLGLMFDEPSLNTNLLDIVKYLKENDKSITLNTNGNFSDSYIQQWKEVLSLLDRKDRIVWSLDGLSNETYIQHRANGDFQRICAHISTSTGTYKRPTHIIQIIKFKHNSEELKTKLEAFQRKHNILWNKPVWDIIESNGQRTIPTDKVQPTWNISKQQELKSLHIKSEDMWRSCTNPKHKPHTLLISHTKAIGFCLPNLIASLKSGNPPLNLSNTIGEINNYLKYFYKNNINNETCQFYCGKNSMLAKKDANLDYDIT